MASAAVLMFLLGGVSFTTAQTTNALSGHVTGTIAVPGQLDRYQFNLDEAGLFYLDSLVNADRLHWTLNGPAGPGSHSSGLQWNGRLSHR